MTGGLPIDVGWVFWAGTMGMESPIAARVVAATAGGCTRVSVSPLDVVVNEAAGLAPDHLKRMLADHGLDIVIDPIMTWFGGPPMPGRFSSFTVDDVMRMSEILEPVSFTAIGPFSDNTPIDDVRGRFATLCDQAAEIGAQVQLEAIVMSAVTDLATAWSIVGAADRPNGGMLVDSWHFFHGTPDFTVLDGVAGDRIFGVQLSDGRLDDSDTFNRLLPGDGEFDLAGLVEALERIGGLRWVGPEILSPVLEAMDPAEVGRLTLARLRELVAR